MSYASTSDVGVQLMRDLTAAEEARARSLLPLADRIINASASDVAGRVLADADFAAVVRVIAASLVARALTVDAGVTASEESIDDYRRVERRESAASEGFTLSDIELALLAPEDVDADAQAFSVVPGGSSPYLTMPDPLGCYPMVSPYR